jgi:predicted transcriptional regulator
MKDVTEAQAAGKEALKKLKAARKDQIAAATARMKTQRQAVKAIKEQLKEGDLTIPELAQTTGLTPPEVMWYVAALKNYGEILEGNKDGSYYRYRLGKVLEEAPSGE